MLIRRGSGAHTTHSCVLIYDEPHSNKTHRPVRHFANPRYVPSGAGGRTYIRRSELDRFPRPYTTFGLHQSLYPSSHCQTTVHCTQCYCGDEYDKYGEIIYNTSGFSVEYCEEEQCSGNPLEQCGGRYGDDTHLAVYRTDVPLQVRSHTAEVACVLRWSPRGRVSNRNNRLSE